MRRFVPLATLLAAAWLGQAQALTSTGAPQVQLNGMLGTRAALLLIDGEPRTVEVGAAVKGVRLIGLDEGRATIEISGRREVLTLGAAPARVGTTSAQAPRQIVMPVGPGGHFITSGAVNGQVTSFLIDTGATSVAIGQIEAERLGLRYLYGRRLVTQTANGLVPAYEVQLTTVRVGDVEVRDVQAIVIPGLLGHVLLGNSFLSRFQMRRENDVMTLELRY